MSQVGGVGRALCLAAAIVVAAGALGVPAAADEDAIGAACPPDEVPRTWFEDISATPHAAAIECVAWWRTVKGRTPTTFAPAAHVTRAQAASFLATALERAGTPMPEVRGYRFEDTVGNVHRDRIEQVAELGVVEGRSATRYAPDEAVSRAQLASQVVAAYATLSGQELPAGPRRFDDTGDSVHADNIDRAAEAGFVEGTGPRTYDPAGAVKRGQFATVIARALSRGVEEGHVEPYEDPAFHAQIDPIPPDVREWMTGRSWHEGCPVSLDDLRLVELVHWRFDGDVGTGHLVLHASVADDVVGAFREIYQARFRIEAMELVDRYDGDDDRSMAANNTSAFNCRHVAGTTRWSEHAYGTALDINPVQNPYVTSSGVYPEAGRDYLDRSDVRLGMIVDGDSVVAAFARIGWGWGGHWSSSKDYQHFSASGR